MVLYNFNIHLLNKINNFTSHILNYKSSEMSLFTLHNFCFHVLLFMVSVGANEKFYTTKAPKSASFAVIPLIGVLVFSFIGLKS